MNALRRLNRPPLPVISAEEYASRRSKLVTNLKKNHNVSKPVVLLNSVHKTYSAPDVPHPFRQCSHFRYLTGCLEPGSRLLITPSESILFVHLKSKKEILWDGDITNPQELKSISNVDQVLPLSDLTGFLVSQLTPDVALAADLRFHDETTREIVTKFSGRKVPLLPEIDNLRWIKSKAELEFMKTAASIGSQALNSLLETKKDVSHEAYISGFLEYEMKLRGADSQAYPPVVAAGARANTIHYIASNQPIGKNDCVLIDAGADYHGYVSDISRCFPSSGSFTKPQRELYEAVLQVQHECLEYAATNRPLKLSDLFMHMTGAMAAVLRSMHFFKKGLSDAELIQICSQLCEHHVSHYLGMDVHDCATVSRSIAIPSNVVITIEPGIYVTKDNPEIHEEFYNTGFRIEDDVLITDSGIEVLSEAAVKHPDEIERLMQW